MACRLLPCASAAVALAVASIGAAHATVAPSLGLLLEQSTLVVVATVAEVESEGGGAPSVVLRPLRFLRGELNPTPESLAFRAPSRGEDAVDFAALRAAGSEHVFFLRQRADALDHVRSFHLELVDPVFGVKPADPALLRRIEQILAAVERAHESPPAP